MRKPLLSLLALASISLSALADGLPPNVLKALKAAQIPAANVAVVVQPVDAAQPLVAHNAAQSMNPASVMKLLTTYAALDLLGPAWTWKTTAWVESVTVDGRLDGNLYLKGSGDPRFAIEHLSGLLRQLRVRGIQHIAGDVVLDRTVFNVPSIDPSAFDDKPMRPYNVGPDGLLINFRALRFTLQPDNSRPRVLMETPSDGLRVDNQLRNGEGGCSSNWKDLINVRLIPENNGNRLEFTGTYSALCGEKPLNLAPLPADAQAGGLIRALWQELGGTLGGQVRAGNVAAGSRLLATHESPPLADAVRDINKYSNNVMAQQVFLSLTRPTSTQPATPEAAREVLRTWWLQRINPTDPPTIDNGSGLSRLTRLTARDLATLLRVAYASPAMPELMASMPLTGLDGTLKRSRATAGRAHLKTGSLRDVMALAGYVHGAHGKQLCLVAIVNHANAAAARPALDALLSWALGDNAGP